jgi:hypothetical protein
LAAPAIPAMACNSSIIFQAQFPGPELLDSAKPA